MVWHLFLFIGILIVLGVSSKGDSAVSKSTNDLVYGINIVWGINGSDENWDVGDMRFKLLNAAKEIGASNTRVGVTWCVVESEKGRYDWDKTDKRVNFLHENGFELVACVANTPTWATGLDEATLSLVKEKYPDFLTVLPCADEYLPSLAKWCEEAAKRYRGKIKYYEIGNEDDGCPAPIVVRDYTGKVFDIRTGGNPAVYTKRLKACYEAIKKADPDAKVAVSGLAGGNHTFFLEQIYACGGKDYFDAVAIHPYDDMDKGINWDWLEQTRDLLIFMGDAHKKLWLTEWGYGVDDNNSDELKQQAESVEQVLLRLENLDYVEQASLHILNDWRSHESNPNSVQKMGLTNIDLQPRPAFHAFKRAAYGGGEMRDTLRPRAQREMREPGGGEPVECPYIHSDFAFSGDIEQWSDAASVILTDETGAAKGRAYFCWDSSNIYIAASMDDHTENQAYGGEWMWRGDSLQVAFDPEREIRKWPDYGYEDVEYVFCLTPMGAQGIRTNGGVNYCNGIIAPLNSEPSVTLSPFKLSVKRDENAYFYEIAIPWTEITPKAISAGKSIGISLAYNDYDMDNQRSKYQFGGGITADKNPSLFKQLKLVR